MQLFLSFLLSETPAHATFSVGNQFHKAQFLFSLYQAAFTLPARIQVTFLSSLLLNRPTECADVKDTKVKYHLPILPTVGFAQNMTKCSTHMSYNAVIIINWITPMWVGLHHRITCYSTSNWMHGCSNKRETGVAFVVPNTK